jgi:hypothetical protein
MHHATPPPSHPTHPMPFSLSPPTTTPKCTNALQVSPYPHLELTQKHPQTYSPAEWTTHAAPKRMMDATTIENCTHHTQKQNEKK